MQRLGRIRPNKPAKSFNFWALTLEYQGSNRLTGFLTQPVEVPLWSSNAPLGKWPCSGRRAELAPPNALGSENSFQDPGNDYFCKLDFRQLATYVLALEVPPMPFRSAHRVRATCIKPPPKVLGCASPVTTQNNNFIPFHYKLRLKL